MIYKWSAHGLLPLYLPIIAYYRYYQITYISYIYHCLVFLTGTCYHFKSLGTTVYISELLHPFLHYIMKEDYKIDYLKLGTEGKHSKGTDLCSTSTFIMTFNAQ